jgi:hypothetical protein
MKFARQSKLENIDVSSRCSAAKHPIFLAFIFLLSFRDPQRLPVGVGCKSVLADRLSLNAGRLP